MTEKRFNFNGRTNCIEFDGKSILCDSYGDELADVMNDLNDKNNQLKHQRQEDINELAVIAMKYKALEDTGNALSRHIDILKIRLQDKDELLRKELEINENYLDKINTLEDTVKEAIKNERTELGQSVLKNLAANLGIHDYDN